MVKREPSANSRQMASALYDMFLALTLEGFTRKEAMQIIGTALSASFIAGGGNQNG